MPRLTDGQIAAARDVGLLSFLSARNGNELIRTGVDEYRTATHGSLVITPRYWYWNKGGFGSASAIDYLVKVCNTPFIEAAREVLSTGLAHEPLDIPTTKRERTRTEPKRSAFRLPPKSQSNDDMMRYLLSRGISQTVILRCIEDGVLYEGKCLCSPACVFVGRDDSGEARFATVRGITADIKRDVARSDKRYSFHLSAQDRDSSLLSAFEAPIDALSHMTLGEIAGWEQGGHRLSLAGTSHIAVIAFLERHRQIRRVILHMDGDAAGIAGALRIKSRIKDDSRFSHVKVSMNPARGGKDYNEILMRERIGKDGGDTAGKGGCNHARRDKRAVDDDCGACRRDERHGAEARRGQTAYGVTGADGKDPKQRQRRRHQTRQTDDGTARKT
jgi:hypothetical protein